MFRHVLTALLLAVAVVTMGGSAQAGGRQLYADLMTGHKLRIDGVLRDWPQQVMRISEVIRGEVHGGDPGVRALIGYDDRFLYVGLIVDDADLVRTKAYGKNEDHAALTIAFPSKGGSYTTETLLLYAGKPGKVAGVVKHSGGGKVAGATIVEAPIRDGYSLEAKIPWSAFRSAKRWRVGLRGALSYVDADKPGKVTAEIGSTTARAGNAMPRLLLESERTLEESVRSNGLGKPAKVLYGDVAGDALMERVAIYRNVLTIVGPGYRKGTEFFYADLGVSDASQITRFQLMDVDGDRKDEIVIQKRLGGTETYREVLVIQKIGADGGPEDLFVHDVAIVTPEGHINNDVDIKPGGRGAVITISQGKTEWSDQSVFQGALQDDIPHALLPWEDVGSRTFEWDGSSFKQTRQKKQKPRAPGKPKPGRRFEGPSGPPPPRPPNPEELLDKVYALYRKDRKVKKAEPRFDFVTDVVAGDEMERVLVHERDIVVFGAGYLGGVSYTFTTMGFAEPSDVLDVGASDLTGDGKAEIIARGVIRAEASEELGGAEVTRYAVYVYKVMGERVQRVFAAETGRALGSNRILGGIAFVPADSGYDIELGPGVAVGWTKRTYPFPEDTEPGGGLQPLPLPWSEASYTFRFDGTSYTRQ